MRAITVAVPSTLIAAVAVGGLSASSSSALRTHSSVAIEHALLEGPDEQTVALAEDLALTPTALAVAGLAASDAALVLSDLSLETDAAAALAAALSDAQTCAAQVTALSTSLLEAPGDSQQAAEFEAAISAWESALADVATQRAILQEEALDGCSQQQSDDAIGCAASAGRCILAHFRVADCSTVEEWRTLERALTAEARAARLGDASELTESAAALLASVRSDPRVIEAEQDLASQLPAIEAVFDDVADGNE